MTLNSLQALTWCTVTGAVVSALLLASGESGLPDLSRLKRAVTSSSGSPPGTTTAAKATRGAAPAGAQRQRAAKSEADGR